jgi:excisionase family DNA binding protein
VCRSIREFTSDRNGSFGGVYFPVKLITAQLAAKSLDIRLPRLYELVRVGAIPHVKLGKRQLRFDPEALHTWAKNGGTLVSDPAVHGESSEDQNSRNKR